MALRGGQSTGNAAVRFVAMHERFDDRMPPLLFDYLYVDLPRVRSLVGQLYQGLPDKVDEISERMSRWALGANLAVAKAEGGKQTLGRTQESRSLAELHCALLEEAAEAAGALVDISEIAADPERWESGALHEITIASRIVRITAPTTLTDPQRFLTLLDQFTEIAGIATSPAAPRPGASPKRPKPVGNDAGVTTMRMIRRALTALYPTNSISIRIEPCGERYPNFVLLGNLPEKSEYIDSERSLLGARYGSEASEWTTVAIVARAIEESPPFDFNNVDFVSNDNKIDRAALERVFHGMNSHMAAMGMSDAPPAPGVAVVPLAIYRTIAKIPVADQP
jgi:hypothetical protein